MGLLTKAEVMLDEIQKIADEAGEAIMGYYHLEQPVDYKEDDSPLTQADRASHELISRRFQELAPEIPIVSEESRPSERQGEITWERFWLVDPLDGTKEFIKKTGEFTVNIALVEGGKPALGVVHAPGIAVSYHGKVGEGAWRLDKGRSAQAIQTRRASPEQLWIVASRDHAGPQVAAMLERIPGHQLTSMGSSLKFCLVAEGKADLYPRLGPTMEWDTAAAQAVLEAAGGRVTDVEGVPLQYRKPDLKNPGIIAVGDTTLEWKQYLEL